MTETTFVILERGFEYNDETYEPNEGGNVLIGIKDPAQAKIEVIERTVGFLKTLQGDRWSNVLNYIDAGDDVMVEFFGENANHEEVRVAFSAMDEAKLREMAEMLDDAFFMIQMIELT